MALDDVLQALEPGSDNFVRQSSLGTISVSEAAQFSQAVSLKRIADALTSPDKYGLSGSASLAQAIVDGLKQ